MNSENKDKWTPEVGKTAWAFVTNEGVVESLDLMGIIYEKGGYFAVMDSDGYVFMRKDFSLFPTPEAALQSIKVYDLEGKEVVIPRARVDLPSIQRSPELTDAETEATLRDRGIYATVEQLTRSEVIEKYGVGLPDQHKKILRDMEDEYTKILRRLDQKRIAFWEGLHEKDVLVQESMKTILDHTHLLNGIDKCHECGGEISEYKNHIEHLKHLDREHDAAMMALFRQNLQNIYAIEHGQKEIMEDADNYYVNKEDFLEWCLKDEDLLCRYVASQLEMSGKIAKMQYSADMSYNPNQDRREGGC